MIAASLSGCARKDEPAITPVITEQLLARSTVPDPAAQACAACHADIVREWEASQHANANRLVSAALDGPAFAPPRTLLHGSFATTTARDRHGAFTFTESFSNQPPSVFHAEAVIGITPLRQYLVTFPDGRLQTVDVSFDPRSNEWFNAFGDDNRQPHEWGHWKNRSMTWNVQCAFCHMTGFEKNYDIPSDSYASTWKAMGISCAQCHTLHDSPASSPTDPHTCPAVVIPDPASRVAYLDNCASCHARREELFGTFRPGDAFHDHFRLALPDTPGVFHPDGQVLDEDFEYASFKMSRMGHAGVSCLDCHNPHSGRLVAPVENNALCMQCHTPPGLNGATAIDPVAHGRHTPGTPGGRCVDCHMPETTYMARDPRRDHGFTSPDPRLTIEHGIPNACNRCHTDQTAEWAELQVNAWYGAEKMADRRARQRARVIARVHAGDAEAADDLLTMARDEEIDAWRTALNRLLARWSHQDDVAAHLTADLEHPSPMVRSAAVQALQDRPDADTLLAALHGDPSALVRVDAAWAVSRTRIPPGGPPLAELRAYLDNISDQPPGALRQAQFALAANQTDDAITWAEKALAWDGTPMPRYALGRIQHVAGDLPAAASNLAAAALAEPDNPEFTYTLALFYAENGLHASALEWLKLTVQHDPSFGRAWYNLGLAHAAVDQPGPALAALEQAERLLAASPEPAYAAATIHYRTGDRAAARAAAQRALATAPAYPPALGLLRELDR